MARNPDADASVIQPHHSTGNGAVRNGLTPNKGWAYTIKTCNPKVAQKPRISHRFENGLNVKAEEVIRFLGESQNPHCFGGHGLRRLHSLLAVEGAVWSCTNWLAHMLSTFSGAPLT